jgi:putative DNA primase/helicase
MSAREIVAKLGGRWYGGNAGYGYVRCVAHEDGRPSLRLRDGDTPGVLLVDCEVGCDSRNVLGELRRRGLIHGEASDGTDAHDDERSRRLHVEAESERRRREGAALAIWKETAPAAETWVEVYLRGRGITIPIPPSLRYHRALKYPNSGLLLPAMVAAVQAPDRQIRGVHRTYLMADGRDKAQVDDPKLSLGTLSTGTVRMAAAGPELAISEGIETGLSFMQAMGIPTWAALSTSGMRAVLLPLLPLASTVYLAADVDPSGAGERAAEAAAERLFREGRKVRIARPVEGKDFNDAIRAWRAA